MERRIAPIRAKTMRMLFFVVALMSVLGKPAEAKFVQPQLEPIDRLVKSATAYLEKHPDEAEAHYTLARIHYLAFSTKRDFIPAYNSDPEEKPRVVSDSFRTMGMGDEESTQAATLKKETLLDHAVQAHREFEKAIRLDPKNGLSFLGLASLLEEVRTWNKTAKPDQLPVELQGITTSKLRALYQTAFSLEYPKDSQSKYLPISGLRELVSYEAATALVRLAEEKPWTGSEEDDVKKARQALKGFEGLPPGAVTPIVFSFSNEDHLADALLPDAAIDFDLRGYGFRQRWSWVKPTLGILVWDPKQEGKITSARQLFGNYTFQIFRKDGYAALAALDDNEDGVLSGRELEGIGVWFDRNSNGVSDPGEVVTVQSLHIRTFATTAEGHDGVHLVNRHGIVLENGHVLPSWDWMATPAQPAQLAGNP